MNLEESSKFWPQWFAAATVTVLALLHGLTAGWSSPYLAKLTQGTESLTITNDEASWVASLHHISRPVGSITGAAIAHKFGSRKGILLAGVPHGVAWTCFLITESVPLIYTSRVCSGLAIGIYLSTFPLYIGEISNTKIRGSLISVVIQGASIGYLIGNILGAYLSMKIFAIIGLTISIIFIVLVSLIPDSSHYLMKRNKYEKAEKSLKWYVGKKDVTVELNALIAYIGEPQKLSIRETFQKWLTPLNRKVLINMLCIHVVMHLGGIHVIRLYMEILLITLKIDIIAPSLAVVCGGIVTIIGGLTAIYTTDHFGRRTMLAISSLGVSFVFFLIGIKFLLFRCDYDISSVQWLVITEFMLYMFFLNIGLACIPCCLVSEVFPTELKEIGACVTSGVGAVIAFIKLKVNRFERFRRC
ncbi:facilitated trehalose transporter Tret1 isoform X2 [Diachasma alloeum]|uniref:facilitated trehalose transporter Tret1 isoform X2 n=1 Tax=Diachasma alloeum TaxID=454923 RepID=UPI00073831B1|nr:facilitated trehalose transporter Tret1 isoform X2 [Diachasma alloeum]